MTETLSRPERILKISPLTHVGVLKLRVTEIKRALTIWRDMIGLHVVQADDRMARLGIGQKVMIELYATADMPVPAKSLGLYHIAIHVPARKELARAIARQLKAGIRTLPTDHLVSEATYLWDLDGNGIELTFETPERGTYLSLEDGIEIETVDGKPHSGREPIDLEAMFAELSPDDDLMAPLPEGTRVGHIHLHVRDLFESMQFYAGIIGLQRQILSTRFGMGDVRTNFEPHVLAFNIWSGPNAQQAPENAAGLTEFELILAEMADLESIVERLDQAGHAYQPITTNAIALKDPSGNPMRLLVE